MDNYQDWGALNYDAWRHIFFPYHSRKVDHVRQQNQRFVHYTSADTAMKIIQDGHFWMRNTTTMNDYSEVEHGWDCLLSAFKDEPGQRFKAAIERVYPGMPHEIESHFKAWVPGIKRDTYLACFSEHDDREDSLGRLSMWRAYGGRNGVALVLNNTAFISTSDALAVYTSAVAYLDKEGFGQYFLEVAEAVEQNPDLVTFMGADLVFNVIWNMFRFGVISTKHPAFSEEREWRAIYTPVIDKSTKVISAVECVNGVPQFVQKIPLQNIPEEGMFGLAIPELLNRVIIGPTEYPDAIAQAFVRILGDAGIPEPATKVHVSNIPLR